MQYGEFIVGEFLGIKSDNFGDAVRVRTGEPYQRGSETKPGREENLEFFQFDPRTGNRTLPESLRVGDTVLCQIRTQSRGYRSADRGISGIAVRTLLQIATVTEYATAFDS